MPTIKTNTRNQTQMSQTRLRILDDLLSKGVQIDSREDLTRRVNQHLDFHVSKFTVDKDLGKLKKLVKEAGVGVKIIRKDGYRYSKLGYTYFQDHVTERELRAFELLSQAYGDCLGGECRLLMQELSRKLHHICPCGPEPAHAAAAAKSLECSPSDNGETPLLMKALSHVEGRTTARLKLLDQRGDDWRHVSPCLVYRDRNVFWLIASDLSEGRTGSFLAVRIADISVLETSNKAFVAGDRLDETAFKKEWTKKLARNHPKSAWVELGSPDRMPAGRHTGENVLRLAPDEEDDLTLASRSPFTTLPGAEGRMLEMIQSLAV